MGEDVLFVCGSDAHGTPIVVNAEAQGLSPRALVDMYHQHFDQVFRGMGIDFDFFGDTDDPECHHRTQEIVRALMQGGYVYPREIELAYCPSCERFLPDRYVEGECPYCGKPARGDECDMGCGRHLEPGEIKNAVCKVCGGRAEYRRQVHYFFKLSAFKDFLLEYLKGLGGTASARNYAEQWVRQELKDWCITRNMSWGVQFPGHNELVVYVWVDAPIGYIAFTEEWCTQNDKDWAGLLEGRFPDHPFHRPRHSLSPLHLLARHAQGAGYTLPWGVVASGMIKVNARSSPRAGAISSGSRTTIWPTGSTRTCCGIIS